MRGLQDHTRIISAPLGYKSLLELVAVEAFCARVYIRCIKYNALRLGLLNINIF